MRKVFLSLFWVSRPVSWINTAYPFGAAYLASGGRDPWIFTLGTLFFLIPYNLVMYGVNDVFDYESDIRNPRKGGIEGAMASRRLHRPILIAAAVASAPFAAYLLTLGNLGAKLCFIYSMAMVLAYSVPYLRFKERPILDSFTSATHFASPMVFALLLTGWSTGYPYLVIAFVAWGMAAHAFGAVQDILPDRAGGIASVATVLGARRTMQAVIALYALAALALLPYGWPGIIVAAAVVPYIHNAARFRHVTDATSAQVNAGWRRFLWLNLVAGFVITQVLIWLVTK
jgi:4-hydroxybenzoate polyprenyltransferase